MRSYHAPGLPGADQKQDTFLIMMIIIAVNSIMHAAHTSTMGRQVGLCYPCKGHAPTGQFSSVGLLTD